MGWRDKVATGEVLTDQEKADFMRETGTDVPAGPFRFKVELGAVVTNPDGTVQDLGIIATTENNTITTPATPGGA